MSTDQKKTYGAVVVRVSDRLILSKVFASPTEGFTIPNTAWADLVSRCGAPHFRTSAFLQVTSENPSSDEVQLSYHVMTDDTLGFAILCGSNVSRREGQAVLDDLSALFRKMYIENPAKLTSSAVSSFAKPAKELLLSNSSDKDSFAKINNVKTAVNEAKNLAIDNVERVIQRDQKIDDIIHASEDLLYHSDDFGRNSRSLADQIWWNSMKGKIIIFGTAAIFLFMVFFVFFSD